MGVGGPPVAIKSGAHAPAPSKLFDLSTIPPRLVSRETPILPSAPPRLRLDLDSLSRNTCMRHAMQTRILVWSGSSRRNSLNQKLLDRAALGARDAGAEITPIRLLDFEMPIYDGDWEAENGVPKGARALQALVTQHDGLLIATT